MFILSYVTLDSGTPLYYLFLILSWKKQGYAPTDNTFTRVFKQLNQIVRFKQKTIKIESLFSMNYLIRKWSQVQNDRKNATIIDTTELTININEITIAQKKALWFFLPWRYGLSWNTTHPPCFPSSNITKKTETHPPSMRDVIIEQPLNLNIEHTLVLLADLISIVNIGRCTFWTILYIQYSWRAVRCIKTTVPCNNEGKVFSKTGLTYRIFSIFLWQKLVLSYNRDTKCSSTI